MVLDRACKRLWYAALKTAMIVLVLVLPLKFEAADMGYAASTRAAATVSPTCEGATMTQAPTAPA